MREGKNWAALRQKLRAMLLEKIEAGKLGLPALPTTAARVLDALDSRSNNGNNNNLAALLETDPALAAEVIRLANSASFGLRVRVESIAHAISLLGAARLRSVMIAATARQVFISRNRTIRKMTGALWVHSVGVAGVARQIALRGAFEDKEAPYLTGLLHDIGKPIVAVHLLELERSLNRSQQDHWIDPNDWLSIIQDLHRPVGIAVVKHWNLSDQIRKAVEDCIEYDANDRMSASNAVRFANALAKREGVYIGAADDDQIETVLMIGRSMLGLDDDAVAPLLQTLRSSAAEMDQAE